MEAALALLPETSKVDNQALQAKEVANSMVISDDTTYIKAGEFLKGLKAIAGEIKETFRPGIEQAFKLHRTLISTEKNHLEPVAEAESIIKKKMMGYQDEQERKRREEEARLREEARKREEEARLAEAVFHEAAGNNEEAEAILNLPIEPPPVILPKATPKVAGISTRVIWKFRIVDANKIPREYMIPYEQAIGALVRALGDAAKIPGIEVYPETNIAAGR
ncbi:MAG: hypothetical protein HZA08_07415 [Nitrospirae bacterium]|nr:hypothetical protein [Nitrospirota bacterium]